MNYHPQDFIALSIAVDKEGGKLLADVCNGKELRYKVPGPSGRMQWTRCLSTHCDQSALMEIPYEPSAHIKIHDDDDDTIIIVDHKGEDIAGYPLAKVCAVDDAVGLWPRYNEIVSKRSYQS